MRISCIVSLLTVAWHVQAQDTTRLSLLFLGDVMQHDSQIAAARQSDGSFNYAECFQFAKPLLQSADITIGNLEVTLAGRPYKGYPQFSAPDALAVELRNVGVDVLVTANNHCVDRGRKGLERTIDVLDSLALPHTGTFKDSLDRALHYPLRVEKEGFVLSLLNYTYGTNGIAVSQPNIVNRIDTVQIAADVEKAKATLPDAIIVFFHWGSEYQSQPNAWQRKVANFCFQRGVKMVIGAHPHVLQPMEWHKDRDQLVVYSMGNFVSGQRDRYKNGGGTVRVELQKVKQDSLATTMIRDVEYDLQYVYRNARKKYFLLPVRDFEADTTVVRETSEQAQLKQFAQDSRDLFSKYNQNVRESMRIYETDSSQYAISADSLVASLQSLYEFYGVVRDSVTNQWLIGKFFDIETAELARQQLQSKGAPVQRVVRLRNGRRED